MALVGAREYIILSTFPSGRGLTYRADSYNITLAVVDHDLVILINRHTLYVTTRVTHTHVTHRHVSIRVYKICRDAPICSPSLFISESRDFRWSFRRCQQSRGKSRINYRAALLAGSRYTAQRASMMQSTRACLRINFHIFFDFLPRSVFFDDNHTLGRVERQRLP